MNRCQRSSIFVFVILMFLKFCSSIRNITHHYNWHLFDHENCGESLSDRIIGGTVASLGQYPWLARIKYSGSFFDDYNYDSFSSTPLFLCGGSLLNKRYVLTAAHCVVQLPEGYRISGVRLGENFADSIIDCENGICAPPPQDFAPVDIITHEFYDTPRYRNDIALIRLNDSAIYHAFVQPICLPWGDQIFDDYVGTTAEVAGWGIMDILNKKSSQRLMTVTLPIVRMALCQKGFQKYAKLTNGQLCVGGQVGKDSCSGDSGGPLMKPSAAHGPPAYYIIGVVSFGAKNCGESITPAVYTNVAMYLEWILNNVRP